MGKDRVANRATKVADAGKTKAPIAAPKAQASTPKKSADLSGFGAAFKKARAQGVGTKFAYNDKQYAAVTKDDISRAGKSSLKEFLESSKRKATTKLAKAPGQREEAIVRKAKGGTITPSRRQRLREMMQKQKEQSTQKRRLNRVDFEKIKGAYDKLGRTPARPMPMDPNKEYRAKPLPMTPGERPDAKKYERSGAAISEGEMQSFMEQMNKPRSMDRFKSGGSVMARGCKMGRKKATKLY
jgi:hypothetical protein